jgi:hypothetical protein
VERGLREGDILCVVATNALELGIDIGELTAVVCAGYPGSIAGTWQRFGRAGRRGETSIAVLAAGSAAIDQYLARHPDYLFDSGAEHARIDPQNTEILIQHLKCSAFELPFVAGEYSRSTPPGPAGAPLPADHGVLLSRRRPLGGRGVPGQPRLAAQHRLGQLRDHRPGVGPEHRRARLARRAHHAARASDCQRRRHQVERLDTTTTRRSCARSYRTMRPRSPTALSAIEEAALDARARASATVT